MQDHHDYMRYLRFGYYFSVFFLYDVMLHCSGSDLSEFFLMSHFSLFKQKEKSISYLKVCLYEYIFASVRLSDCVLSVSEFD